MNDKAFYLHFFLTNLQKQYKKQSIEMADAFVRFGGDMDAIEYSFKRQQANNTRGRQCKDPEKKKAVDRR